MKKIINSFIIITTVFFSSSQILAVHSIGKFIIKELDYVIREIKSTNSTQDVQGYITNLNDTIKKEIQKKEPIKVTTDNASLSKESIEIIHNVISKFIEVKLSLKHYFGRYPDLIDKVNNEEKEILPVFFKMLSNNLLINESNPVGSKKYYLDIENLLMQNKDKKLQILITTKFKTLEMVPLQLLGYV